MRYALISDVHANLPALDAVLADIATRPDIDATYHLGDLVGYAASSHPRRAKTTEKPGDGCATA
jgi:predicted phosphodiesterase